MKRHFTTTFLHPGPLTAILFSLALALLFVGPKSQLPAAGQPPVVFLHDPLWPVYAQTEITVFPEPPAAGRPSEVCVWVANESNTAQTVTIDFGVSDFGIGMSFQTIGSRTISVAAQSRGVACMHWVPSKAARWCIQAVLHVPGYPDQTSQRNIDLWEVLTPGTASQVVFLVRNPSAVILTMQLQTRMNPARTGWSALLSATEMQLFPGQIVPVTLTVTPPPGAKLGTRETILDVEAKAMIGQETQLIGGFRKLDWPPVLLHRQRDPVFAESEISVVPYPARAREPVRICVELTNEGDLPRTVQLAFQTAPLGIGLTFTTISTQTVTLPPHSTTRFCAVWVPPQAGQFCVQIVMRDPQNTYVDQISQRNMDVNEILLPEVETAFVFPVRNPDTVARTIHLTATKLSSFFDLRFETNPLAGVLPDKTAAARLYVTLKQGAQPADDDPVADIQAYYYNDRQEQVWIGGIRKIYKTPIPIHRPDDPPYAEREISIDPYPPRAGEPTQICVELRNPTAVQQIIQVEFAIASFGIGLPFTPIQQLSVALPANSILKKCITWVPPIGGHFCVQVTLRDSQQQPRFPEVKSQRNMDVGEVFVRGQTTSPFLFHVANPGVQNANIELVTIPRLAGWTATLDKTLLTGVNPAKDLRQVSLTVSVPDAPLPQDEVPVVDVEAYTGGRLIGGFRKIYRPPVPVHRPQDPVYAESEISIHPYPPQARTPTQICVDLRNPTELPQAIDVTFAVAEFGIGLPFHDISKALPVTVAARSSRRSCITWVPPTGGQFCARVTLQNAGHDPVWSQRNMDVNEVLVPGQASTLTFPVGNPGTADATVSLGLIPRLDQWDVQLSAVTLADMKPGETRPVTLTVTPPAGQSMPPDGTPVVDVEGYIGKDLIGGIRKIYRPPVPIHLPRDPIYAESEIFVDPYPVQTAFPTRLGVVVFNPTDTAQDVTVNFSVADFGIGLAFGTTGIPAPSRIIAVPPHGSSRAVTLWNAPRPGLFCIQVQLLLPGRVPVYSRRNIDVGEPLRPDKAHERTILVRNPMEQVKTIQLSLFSHRPDWTISLTPMQLADVPPGETRQATLSVKPPSWAGLADEQPVADIEAYIDGELIGGIRKIAKPPVPLHKPQDLPYAESEISLQPDPPEAARNATLSTELTNSSEASQTIRVEFRVANFGIGVPFGTSGIATPVVDVTLAAGATQKVSTQWVPPSSGHWCIQVALKDPLGQYPDQYSQRNIDIERRVYAPCEPFTKQFVLQNTTSQTITVTVGSSALNLPPGWTYTATPNQVTLGPNQSVTITLTITPPCQAQRAPWGLEAMLDTGGATGPPEINIEAYVDGQLMANGGGVQILLESPRLYLPLILK